MSERPFCETCGKDVAEVLCPTCAKWWADNPPDLVTVPRTELEAIRNAIGEVVGAMLEGGDGETGDFGWNISKLTKARPAIRDGLAKLEAHLKAHGGNDAE